MLRTDCITRTLNLNKPELPAMTGAELEHRRMELTPKVWKMRIDGMQMAEISDKLNVPLRTIERWIQKDKAQSIKDRETLAGLELELSVERNQNIYKIAMEAIKQTVTNEDGSQQVFMDHKSADIALKALKEMARLMALGVKEEKSGDMTLESLILASLSQNNVDVPEVIEGEVTEVEE